MGYDNPNTVGGPDESASGTHPRWPLDETLSQRPRLQALPTRYAGCEFRSRLEAKWAVWFNDLAIEWHYELQGYDLAPFGEWYRPDFYLPELGCWIEVKPPGPDKKAQRKTYLFNQCLANDEDPARSRERAFVLHGGIPWPYPKKGNIIGFSVSHEVKGGPSQEGLCWQMCPICQQILIGRIHTFACHGCKEELALLLEDALDAVEAMPLFDKVIDIVPAMVSAAVKTEFFRSGHMMPRLQEAYAKARAARFGEGGRQRSA